MRSDASPESPSATGDDWLTTGQAARLLGVSRQHVVDLCNRGDLPWSSTGAHRRVRREDVETLQATGARASRDQRRSLWLSYAVAGHLVTDPVGALDQARANLAVMRARHTRGQAAKWLAEWAELLDGPVEDVLAVLTSPVPRARELRQNSPFAGVLSEEERQRVLAAFDGPWG
jgi:excisionase family DNA binding protein